MPTLRDKSVTIVGAGLSGSLVAIYLARLGWTVRMFERRPDPRAAGYVGGRSINLALSARGFWGLEGVGLADEVRQRAIPMRGRLMHSPVAGAPLVFQPYSSRPQDAINSISRGELNIALLEACSREPNITLAFNHRCADIDPDSGAARFVDESRGAVAPQPVTVQSRLTLGADGAFSPVRLRLQRTDRFEYSQTYLPHGYKELHIPPTPSGDFAMEPGALHIWPRSRAMMIALPNLDRSFTCTLFWPFEGEHSFANLSNDAEVIEFFQRHYPDVPALTPTLCADYAANPVSSLVTVRCAPWYHCSPSGACTVLAGDASHAIVPFFGQGMNCAFEDCRVLAECLAHDPNDLPASLAAYHRLRKPNADAIADMAIENFVEMRDLVGNAAFLRRKKLEQVLHEWFPDRCVPKYNLVSFSTVPYVEALSRGNRLSTLIDRLLTTGLVPDAPTARDARLKAAATPLVRELFGSETAVDLPPTTH